MNVFCGYTDWSKDLMKDCMGFKIQQKENLKYGLLETLNPKYVFFLHWSWKVPKEITSKFQCVGFHAAPLPKFRGGSPIKNQIKRGIKKTKLTAFYMTDRFDAGKILVDRDLNLDQPETNIFKDVEVLAKDMIKQIIKGEFKARDQVGEPSYYWRKDAK